MYKNIMETKVCNRCGVDKYTNEFQKDKSKRDGLRTICKRCCSNYEKTKRQRPESYMLNYQKNYRATHQEEIKQYREDYKPRRNELRNERKKTDTGFKLLENCRCRVYKALKGISKSDHTKDLLGFLLQFLKEWLEFNFYDDMSWDNYGIHWELEHTRPCASFNFEDPDEQKLCFNWKNLTCLRSDKNRAKRDNRDIFAELMQELKVKYYLAMYAQKIDF